MIGPWIILAGLGLLGLAVAVGMNTSMGGTRSDYDDGSGCLAYIGMVCIPVGIVTTLGEYFG